MGDRTTDVAPKEQKTQKAAPEPATKAPEPFISPMLTLQQQAGNNAVVGRLAEAGIQPKLEVGAVTDPAEAEADRMADEVLRSLDGGGAEANAPVARLSRMIRRSGRPDAASSPGHGVDGGPVESGVEAQIQRARGGGQPLDAKTKSDMEGGFGADFSSVRVHTGGEADTLSRALNAKAFTTGNDIFFSSGTVDRKVLAHELAHTVQQGAAPVRRFMAPADFAKLTYQSLLTAKSTAQTTIEGYLTQYAALGTPVAKTAKPDPKKPSTGVVIPPEKFDNAFELLNTMKRIAEGYISSKEKTDSDGVKAKDKKTKVLGEDRNKRVAGFQSFLVACNAEIAKLNTQKAAQTGAGPKQDAITVDTSGKQKVFDKYEGNLGTCLGLAATAIGALVTVDGDQADLEVKLTIPVPPTNFFVGATLRFDVRKDEGRMAMNCDAMFTGGAKFGIANINAGLGGYFKVVATDANKAMKLMSYGLYRRCRESSVIPSEIADGIWGEKGDSKGEKWSKNVEKDELGKGSKQSVEMGGMAEVGAGLETGVVEGEARIGAKTGKKYDAESLEKSKKGGAGKDNTKGENWFAQESTGASVSSVETKGKLEINIPAAGKVGVDSKLVVSWRDNKTKDAKGKEIGAEIDNVFWELRGNTQFPANDFAGKVAAGASTFALFIKDQVAGEWKKLDAKKIASAVATKGYSVADAATTGMHNVGFSEYCKQKLAEPHETPKPVEGVKPADPNLSRIGIEFAYTYNAPKGEPTQMFEVRQLTSNSVKVPEILKVTLQKRKRIVGVKKVGAGGSWAFIG